MRRLALLCVLLAGPAHAALPARLVPSIHAGSRPGFELTYPRALVASLSSSALGPPPLVLDVGTGKGQIASWVSSQGLRVLGLDGNLQFLAEAAASPGPAYAAASFSDGLPVRSGAVQGAMLHRTLSAIPKQETRSKVISELYRVIEPGGWASMLDFREVKASEEHGEWYQQRYALTRRVIPALIRRGRLSDSLAWLAEEGASPSTLVLRDADGRTVDATQYASDDALLADIDAGRARVLFVSIQPDAAANRAAFEARGFETVSESTTLLPHVSGRVERLQSLLLRKPK